MTSIHRANGTAVSKSGLTTLLGAPITQEAKYTVPETIYRKYRTAGARGSAHDSQQQVLFHAGQVITQSELDAAFPAASISSVSPSTGLPAAGGTVVTINGSNLGGVTSVTFGGTAGTALTIVDDRQIKVTSPAKTAGAHALVAVDDSGNAAGGNVTYV